MKRIAPLLALLVALVGTAAIWRHPGHLAGSYDWRYFQTVMEAARRSLIWFYQAPLYNPWMCGGEVQLANPQSVVGSPAFLLVALFGTALGAKLMLVLFVALGVDGTRRLGRALGLEEAGAWAAALCFGLSGWVCLHFAIGHVSFFGATLIPHLLWCYVRARDDLRWSVAIGAIAALVVAQGGTSTAAMAAVALVAVALVDAMVTRSPRPLAILGLSGLAAALLGAYRIVPALQFAIDHPRHVTETDRQGLAQLLGAAFTLVTSGRLPGYRYGIHEYGWRLPFLAWPLLAYGAVALADRRHGRRHWLGLVGLALVVAGAGIAMGEAWPYGPWWLMRHLPVLRDLRVPSRYVLLCALGCALVVGAGLDALRARLPRAHRLATATVLFALAVDGVIYANGVYKPVFALPTPPIDRSAAFYQVRGQWSRMLPLVFANQGVIGCDEEAPLTRALVLDEGPGPQARLEDPSAGQLDALRWSPNRIDVDVRLERPTRLLVNLNWNEHWKTSAGEVVRHGDKWPADKDGGRLAVALPVMQGPVVLRYRPTSWLVGCTISLASLLAIAIYARRRVRASRYCGATSKLSITLPVA